MFLILHFKQLTNQNNRQDNYATTESPKREQAMQKQFLQEIVEPENQTTPLEEFVQSQQVEAVDEQPKAKKKKSRKKILNSFDHLTDCSMKKKTPIKL